MSRTAAISKTPFFLAVPFAAVITGLFNLADFVPVPIALGIGAAWGIVVGLIASRVSSSAIRGAWIEDALVYLGTVCFAFAGCGGLMAILLLKGAIDSSSLTGESLEQMFLPSIPYYIAVNSVLEVLVIPAILYFAWRPGRRRILIVATAAAYFVMRVWTYLAIVPARLGWADSAHSTQTLTPAERHQAAKDLMLNDPRWIPLLLMFATFLVAAHLPRTRDLNRPAH